MLSRPGTSFREICLFEPDQTRRETIGRLAVEVAAALGHRDVVRVTPDAEEAFTGADFVFSAIRVGGDRGRLIDEEVALRRGLVGQETTGPGGCAMALRTIPVVLSYCDALARYAPGAVLINFTNPAGLITQAISLHASGPRGRRLRHPERGARPAGRVPGRRPGPGRVLLRRPEPPGLDLLVPRGRPRMHRHAA